MGPRRKSYFLRGVYRDGMVDDDLEEVLGIANEHFLRGRDGDQTIESSITGGAVSRVELDTHRVPHHVTDARSPDSGHGITLIEVGLQCLDVLVVEPLGP